MQDRTVCRSRSLWGISAQNGFKSSNKAERLSTLPLKASFSDVTKVLQVPIHESPAHVPILWMDPPGLMRNSEVTEFEITVFGSEGIDASAVGADFFVREFGLDVTIFARVLAKIAHGLATLTLGVDGFEPLLPYHILNAERNPFWLVGGYREKTPASHEHSSTSKHTCVVSIRHDFQSEPFIAVELRLFANWSWRLKPEQDRLGTPTYLIVAGRPNGFSETRLGHGTFYSEPPRRKPQKNRY